MPRKYLDLLVVPGDAGRIHRYRIPQWSRSVLYCTAALVVLALAGTAVFYVRMMAISRANSALYTENEGLRRELATLGGQIDQLDGKVRSQIRLANDARLQAGLPPFGEEVALLGVGGTAGFEPGSEDLPIPLRRTVSLYRDRVDRLGQQLEFQEESYAEVQQVILDSKTRLNHLPTINPLLGSFSLSSLFGTRNDPFTGRPKRHMGLDLCAQRGTRICATADGRVVSAGREGELGLTVRIDHQNGFMTIYGHADQLLVREGQSVQRGDVIATVGRTGRTTGSHLHYEILKDHQAINPAKYILQG